MSIRIHAMLRPLVLLLVLAAAGADAGDLSEGERIARAMGLTAGMTVADVGAGYGQWTSVLLEHVGPTGNVFATEVDETALEELKNRFAGDENVRIVRGTDVETGLPEGCCDAILLRLVYHHFEKPKPMLDGLRKALRPGGRLVVVEDQEKEEHGLWCALDSGALSGAEELRGHTIPMTVLVDEVTARCFHVVERYEIWNNDYKMDDDGTGWNAGQGYCVVFESGCDPPR